ncbi:MAG: GumN family protein [Pedosphaera sp.]|nr:GumN family protein [Pedosphaera sp.]
MEGKSNVVYLLGSVHVLKSEDYPLAGPIETAFTNSGIAVFETDMDAMEKPETQMKMVGKMRLPDGETLKQQLSADVYEDFSKRAKESGLPIEMFDSLKPSMAAMTLEMVELQKLGVNPHLGVDQYFFHRTAKEGKQVIGLETIDFQIGMVTDFSKEEGDLLMKITLKDIDKTKKLFGEMITAWKTGDSSKIETMLNDNLQEVPAIFKRMVTDRSRNWMPKIEELLHGDKNAIIIVGAGHLVGKEGVVEMLQKKGYKTTQL